MQKVYIFYINFSQIENPSIINEGDNDNLYPNSGFGNNQNDQNQYINYENSHNIQQNYMENNKHEEESNYMQYQNNPNFNMNNNANYNYEGENKNEFNHKYNDNDNNYRNYDNNFVNQSVKNIFPVQEKDEIEINYNLKGNGRSMDSYNQKGAYEKNKDQSWIGDSSNKENRNSFAYDSIKSKRSLNGKNNEIRYLQGKN